jgi:hypothetical protein
MTRNNFFQSLAAPNCFSYSNQPFGAVHKISHPSFVTLAYVKGTPSHNTMDMSEVQNTGLELIAWCRMVFHYLRLYAALKAFHGDMVERQQWWVQNLKFELVYMSNNLLATTHNAFWQTNALTFVGLCTTQGWNVSVPKLIHLLGRLLLGKTEWSALSTTNDRSVTFSLVGPSW